MPIWNARSGRSCSQDVEDGAGGGVLGGVAEVERVAAEAVPAADAQAQQVVVVGPVALAANLEVRVLAQGLDDRSDPHVPLTGLPVGELR
jgi:hypothetical protein